MKRLRFALLAAALAVPASTFAQAQALPNGHPTPTSQPSLAEDAIMPSALDPRVAIEVAQAVAAAAVRDGVA